MAINYPASLDALVNPAGSDYQDDLDHASIHSNANDAIEALESKVGVSAGTPVAGRVLTGTGNGTSVWSGTVNLNLGTLGTINANLGTIGTVVTTNLTATAGTLQGVLLGTSTITGGTISISAGTISSMLVNAPKIGTALYDTSNNEFIKVGVVASAVNEVTISNAGTSVAPIISATGDDTNIGLDIKAKGTATVRKPASAVFQVVGGATSVSVGDGKAYFTVPEELNGMDLVGYHARVVTPGTTNSTLIQVYNVSGTADMFSTGMTIASGSVVANVGTIDTAHDHVATDDLLRIDVDSVSTTAPKGLVVKLRFDLP